MIKIDYIATCDKCVELGQVYTWQQSSRELAKTEFGEMNLRTFWKALEKLGWMRTYSERSPPADCCPRCVRALTLVNPKIRKSRKRKP